jgi:aspartate racemase
LGIEVYNVDEALQARAVQPAIYDPTFGIKACGQATEKSRANLLLGVQQLRSRGAQALILGCTELPLAIPEKEIAGMIVIDPALVLARALIAAVDPARLVPAV